MNLFTHQKTGIELGSKKNVAYFWDCGTGKTAMALNLIKHYKAEGPAVVVCPLSIIESAWMEDCKRFTPELKAVSLWSKNAKERKYRLGLRADLYIVNYETFKLLYADIISLLPATLIVDESSKLKHVQSQITRALLALAGIPTRSRGGVKFLANYTVPHRYVLSGTPAPNDESEYWSQIKFITGPGNKCFNDNYYAFRNIYFHSIPLGLTGQKIFRFKSAMKDTFMQAMSPVTSVLRKEDVLDLPEQIHQIRKVYLSQTEMTAYKTLQRELVLRFENQTVLARTELTEVMKLRQLTSGFAYSDTGIVRTGISKLRELRALLEEIGNHQVIIWANFQYEISSLLKELPSSDALWSRTADRDLEKIISGFKHNRYQYLIANPQSAAHGLTFTNCHYAIYFSLNYSYELQKQSQDRIHRIGQKEQVTYYYLVADKTIDEEIYKAVNRKMDLSKTVLRFLMEGARSYGKKAAVTPA